jgi:hypothetical protein
MTYLHKGKKKRALEHEETSRSQIHRSGLTENHEEN